jgi:protocatechuate 3,4-dioxygenase, beta subunit
MNRRELLKQVGIAATALVGASALAKVNECSSVLTPPQTKGPFYPVLTQVDTDADLVRMAGTTQQAAGKVVVVEGIVSDQLCNPVSGVLVEIWQACESGRYNHPSDPNTAPLDPNFQYWGKAVTGADGKYRFRTIIPGAYPAADDWMRPPHIHFKVSRKGYRELITQMYFAGEALNDRDLILQDLPPQERKEVVVLFVQKFTEPHPIGQFNIKIEKIKR